ncbi:PQQ-dependent sugar dehydrogenase [Stenotrophomonas sp. VV52]|uniref:PQQ-dependent sugar dehydrogenase n=1 Tax=Stenotrophomonas sp. VV52 TaxID=2066958 RepID=UPI000C9E8B53|nr:PQQ-dependent sugar dehydrogenase [Stenotrophomonas sp. VV52]
MTRRLLLSVALAVTPALFTTACVAADKAGAAAAPQLDKAQWPFTATEVARFDQPWAMSFLPDGTLLVTEKEGKLKHFNVQTKKSAEITGVPKVAYGGQGGFGDILPHPQFAKNQFVYLSYAEEGEKDTRGAAVARAKLVLAADGSGKLEDLKVIWRQTPKVEGKGHYGHRLAFGPDGKLWITSSERQKFDPAQDMSGNLGKIIRLNDDGSVPADNPFASQGGVAAQAWSLGHRNALGIAFDARGKLWVHEMGPAGGDELNLITRGANYGYPIVSNGNHYDGRDIPDHDTRPEFAAPKVTWTPVISPAGFIIYSGKLFPQWTGSGFIGGLSSTSLVRVAFDGDNAREAERFKMGERIREVEQGPDGAIWLLEDGSNAKLLKLTPKG